MNVDPTPEHRWLHRLLGDWTWASEAVLGHDHPTVTGTETFHKLGEVWVRGEGKGAYGDSQMTLGFDSRAGRFVGSWVGSSMTWQWVYDGALDPTRTRLALHTVGPSFAGDGTIVPYIDEIELVGDDERVLRASYQNPDGSWTLFMTTRYRRV